MMSMRARGVALGALVCAVALLPMTGRATDVDGADRGSLLGSIGAWMTSPAAGISRASLAAMAGDFAFSIRIEVTRGRIAMEPRDAADEPLRATAAFAESCARLGLGRSCDAAFLAELELGTSCASLARSFFGALDLPLPEPIRSALDAAAKLGGVGMIDAVRAVFQPRNEWGRRPD